MINNKEALKAKYIFFAYPNAISHRRATNMSDKKHWACGNKNASKPKSKKNNATLHVGCKSSDKKKWERRAAKEDASLAKLTVKALNEYCGKRK